MKEHRNRGKVPGVVLLAPKHLAGTRPQAPDEQLAERGTECRRLLSIAAIIGLGFTP
jgi:hypothetical protein